MMKQLIFIYINDELISLLGIYDDIRSYIIRK